MIGQTEATAAADRAELAVGAAALLPSGVDLPTIDAPVPAVAPARRNSPDL